MKRLLPFFIAFFCLIKPVVIYADTVDVWKIKLNDEIILNSNQTEIFYYNKPMKVHISSFSDYGKLDFLYWTDTGSQMHKWFLVFKDKNGTILNIFTNPIDSSRIISPCPFEIIEFCTPRKAFISYNVNYLKQLMKQNGINTIFVFFEYDKQKAESLLNKPLCVISND